MTTSATTIPDLPTASLSETPSAKVGLEIVVGIDNVGLYRPVVALLERLRFPLARYTMIHSAKENFPFVPAFGTSQAIEAQYAKTTTSLGELALGEATKLFNAQGLPAEAHLTHGKPSERLVAEAEARGADLIAVYAVQSKRVGSSAVGSVSHALVVASTASVLVAKGEPEGDGPLRAVFATDHSPFAALCFDRFLGLAPEGIEEIDVVSAWEIDEAESEILGQNLTALDGDADRWIEEAVEARNAEVCRRLEEAGYRTRSLVRRGDPNAVIPAAMRETAADLLIIGSQGSGAMTRALVGSVSLNQVSTETYSILIVRPKEA